MADRLADLLAGLLADLLAGPLKCALGVRFSGAWRYGRNGQDCPGLKDELASIGIKDVGGAVGTDHQQVAWGDHSGFSYFHEPAPGPVELKVARDRLDGRGKARCAHQEEQPAVRANAIPPRMPRPSLAFRALIIPRAKRTAHSTYRIGF